jgi:hypothetical protein
VLFSYEILESEIMFIKDDGTLKALANRVIKDDIFIAYSRVASYGGSYSTNKNNYSSSYNFYGMGQTVSEQLRSAQNAEAMNRARYAA